MKNKEHRYQIDPIGYVYFAEIEVKRQGGETTEAVINRRVVCRTDQELGVGFDNVLGLLMKHGSAETVQKWADMQRARYGGPNADIAAAKTAELMGEPVSQMENIRQQMLDSMTVMTFPATEESVAAMNHLIAHHHDDMIERFQAQLADLARPYPQYPA